MSVGGLVGGANIIDQIAGRVDPSRVIARINDQDISPDYFNNLVNQQINQAKENGQTVNDALYERVRNSAWTNLVQEVLVSAEIKRLGLGATDEEIIYHLRENPPEFLRSNPTFQTDGNFDSEKYLVNSVLYPSSASIFVSFIRHRDLRRPACCIPHIIFSQCRTYRAYLPICDYGVINFGYSGYD